MAKIYPRGVRGLIGLRRQFKVMDSSGDGVLNYEEFAQAISDFQIFLSDVDIRNAFKAFDLNQNGAIEYDEFAKVLIGPMNNLRSQIVQKAFDRLDVNQTALVDMDEIVSSYNADRHPDVVRGKKMPEEAKAEFAETFE